MPAVHIRYGFTEGRWHGKKFRRALQRRGYTISRSMTAADIIIGHSAGCYDVTPLHNGQVLMLVNPTYWPGRSIPLRAKNMTMQIIAAVRPGNRPLYHVYKTLHNGGYLLYHHKRNRHFAVRAKTFDLRTQINHGKLILIRNDNDPWLTPDLNDLQAVNPAMHIVHLPGDHDDMWLHPEPYIDALENFRRGTR